MAVLFHSLRCVLFVLCAMPCVLALTITSTPQPPTPPESTSTAPPPDGETTTFDYFGGHERGDHDHGEDHTTIIYENEMSSTMGYQMGEYPTSSDSSQPQVDSENGTLSILTTSNPVNDNNNEAANDTVALSTEYPPSNVTNPDLASLATKPAPANNLTEGGSEVFAFNPPTPSDNSAGSNNETEPSGITTEGAPSNGTTVEPAGFRTTPHSRGTESTTAEPDPLRNISRGTLNKFFELILLLIHENRENGVE